MFTNCASSAFNCGYARVAIRELTPCKRLVDIQKRQEEFQKLFGLPTYSIPSNYYDQPSKYRPSVFDRHADAVLEGFTRKWHSAEAKDTYSAIFSTEKWKGLSPGEQSKHTLGSCVACYDNHYSTQVLFPVKPTFIPDSPAISISPSHTEKENAKRVLTESNRIWEHNYGRKFSEALPKLCPDANLTKKVSKQERKKQNRVRDRRIVQYVNEQMASNITLVTLSSGESMAGY